MFFTIERHVFYVLHLVFILTLKCYILDKNLNTTIKQNAKYTTASWNYEYQQSFESCMIIISEWHHIEFAFSGNFLKNASSTPFIPKVILPSNSLKSDVCMLHMYVYHSGYSWDLFLNSIHLGFDYFYGKSKFLLFYWIFLPEKHRYEH